MDGKSKKCLMRWHEYSDSVALAVQTLRYHEELFDVTLACEGHTVRAHKLVLAASSQYFRQVLKDYPCEHPTIIIDGIKWKDLLSLLQFMYYGQVLIEEEAVCSLLTAATSLDVVGLNYVTAALTQNKLDVKNNTDTETHEKKFEKLKCDGKQLEEEVKIESVKSEVSAKTPNSLSLSDSNLSQLTNEDTLSNSAYLNTPTPDNFPLNEPNIPCVVNNERLPSTGLVTTSVGNHSSPKVVGTSVARSNSFTESSWKESDRPPPKRLKRAFGSDSLVQRNCFDNDSAKGNIQEIYTANVLSRLQDPEKDQKRIHIHERVLSDKIFNDEIHRENTSPIWSRSTLNHHVNGDDTSVPRSYDDGDSLDNELSQDGSSSDNNVDPDMGPAPLPMNHPAVIASSKSAAAVSAAAAALAVAANGGNVNSSMNYAALLAANARGIMSSSVLGNVSPLHNNSVSPSGVPVSWMPPSSNGSPSPSPPPGQSGLPQGYLQSSGMSQDLQATLEQYQRKLAFHEPRPCPTCRRMYRDAATLRTHIAIMHSEGKEPFSCTCGILFRTKYDMYQHKKNGHR